MGEGERKEKDKTKGESGRMMTLRNKSFPVELQGGLNL
jgi:hypothetical protein